MKSEAHSTNRQRSTVYFLVVAKSLNSQKQTILLIHVKLRVATVSSPSPNVSSFITLFMFCLLCLLFVVSCVAVLLNFLSMFKTSLRICRTNNRYNGLFFGRQHFKLKFVRGINRFDSRMSNLLLQRTKWFFLYCTIIPSDFLKDPP